ncbi:MAG: CbiX/SirB N-terminal domain-containing protein [Proteobacteria bacterium]|nr:CbiX/SirB N-terminal domain-containing protein [Pseudomonadota bacterium]MBU2227077.1 CbiX/SirB N-terminal domain-containing protein [Pseudomonadota bacterium]MBU2262283.1 CbiX/SirB N-terminal domain-containing protein [Pseudomonadota bacterium]
MTGKCVDHKKGGNGKRAVILIGHGSRAAGADEDMERIAQRLRAAGNGTVEVCRMSGRGTPFAEVFEKCVGEGATTVIVIPYFLHFGVHLRQDLPAMLREAVAGRPEVRMVLGPHLGYDDALVSLVEKRLAESEGLCDIRELPPTPLDRRPGREKADLHLDTKGE